jgi:hypothetical protein
MKIFKTASLVLAGVLAIAPAAFARGGGGGGHAGGGGFHAGGGHGGSFGHARSGHFAGWYGGHWYGGWPRWLGYSANAGIYGYDDYADTDSTPNYSDSNVVTVQRALTSLGYYHGPVDGVVGPATEKAIRWFQTENKLPVTGQIDSQTLKALWIS